MRNWTLFHVWGIPIRVNITLLVFLPALAYIISRDAGIEANAALLEAMGPHALDVAVLTDGMTPWLIGLGAAVGLFVGVTLHELGHSWMAMRHDIAIASITLWIFGGLARLEDIPEDWDVEFSIALAGPAVSVLVGVLTWGLFLVMPSTSEPLLFIVGWLAFINIILAGFNMLPAFPMDGGRVLRALLARNRPYVEATRTAAAVGKGFAIVFAVVGILALAPILVLVAMFVYIAAGGESRVTVLRDLLRGVTVADIMDEIKRPLSPDQPVADGLAAMLEGRATAVALVDDDGGFAGLVTMADIQSVDPTERDSTPLGSVATTDGPTVTADLDAFGVLQAFSLHRTDRLPVVDDGRLVGSVSRQGLTEAIEVIQGLRQTDPELVPGRGYP